MYESPRCSAHTLGNWRPTLQSMMFTEIQNPAQMRLLKVNGKANFYLSVSSPAPLNAGS